MSVEETVSVAIKMVKGRTCVENRMFFTTGSATRKMCVQIQVMTGRAPRIILQGAHNINLCMIVGSDLKTRALILKLRNSMQSPRPTPLSLITKKKTTMVILQTSHCKAKGIMAGTVLPVKLLKGSP